MLWTAISRQRVKVRSSVNEHLACDSKKFIQREGYKSERRMPRLLEAMKDVVSCDKRRGTANRY